MAQSEPPGETPAMNPTVTEIVKKFLMKAKYDGLYHLRGCACTFSDLAPCGEIKGDCRAGYRGPCPPDCGEHDFHIGPNYFGWDHPWLKGQSEPTPEDIPKEVEKWAREFQEELDSCVDDYCPHGRTGFAKDNCVNCPEKDCEYRIVL